MKTTAQILFLTVLFSCNFICAAQPVVNKWTSPGPLDPQSKTVLSQIENEKDGMRFTPEVSTKKFSTDGYEFRYGGRVVSATYPPYGGLAVITVKAPLGMRYVKTELTRSAVRKPGVEKSSEFRSASINPDTVPEKYKPRRMTLRKL